MVFIASPDKLTKVGDVDFALDGTTWDFLTAAWVKEINENTPGFDFQSGIHFRERILAKRYKITSEIRDKHVGEYGREL